MEIKDCDEGFLEEIEREINAWRFSRPGDVQRLVNEVRRLRRELTLREEIFDDLRQITDERGRWIEQLKDEVQRLTAERDEARRAALILEKIDDDLPPIAEEEYAFLDGIDWLPG